MSLNAFMDRKQVRITTHDDSMSETITGYKEFRIALTSNTNGSADDIDLYNTANVQDQAMINRVDMFINVPYPSESSERKIIAQLNPDMDGDDVKRMAKFSQLMHRGYESREIGTAFSIRNLIALSKLTSAYTLKEALAVNFLNRLSESDVQDVRETIRGIWG
jgi:cobaltochelatase CobS